MEYIGTHVFFLFSVEYIMKNREQYDGGDMNLTGFFSKPTSINEIGLTQNNGITACDPITKENNPALFRIKEYLYKKYKNIHDYYFPIESDLDEVAVEKCDRLNVLRQIWIDIKKMEEEDNNEIMIYDPKFKIERPMFPKAKIGLLKQTRFFSFLMANYCNKLFGFENNVEPTAGCAESGYDYTDYNFSPVFLKYLDNSSTSRDTIRGGRKYTKRRLPKCKGGKTRSHANVRKTKRTRRIVSK